MNAVRFDALVKSFSVRRTPLPPLRAQPIAAAPLFQARTLYGRVVTSSDLLKSSKPLLLIFTHPACGPCYELLPNVAGWQRVYGDRLTIALVSSGTADVNRAMIADDGLDADLALLQAEQELSVRFGIDQVPAAVLLHLDGHSTAPVFGAAPIRQFVADTLGLVLRPTAAQATAAVAVGERAPMMRRSTLDGAIVDLAAARDEPTLALFWSPGCHHCQELLPRIRQWETRTEGPRLLIIARGPIGLNQQVGFQSPVILDDDRSVAGALGVTGTPAAVLIDASGWVGSAVARGNRQVQSLAEQVFALDPTAAT